MHWSPAFHFFLHHLLDSPAALLNSLRELSKALSVEGTGGVAPSWEVNVFLREKDCNHLHFKNRV